MAALEFLGGTGTVTGSKFLVETRDQLGMPTGWVAKMCAGMARLTPRFSTNRVVREYTEKYYVPAAAAYRTRAADHVNDGEPERHAMERARKLDEPDHGYEYGVSLPAARPLGDYTPRHPPRHPIASVPLEAHEILWQR